jgi:hypothetical protein
MGKRVYDALDLRLEELADRVTTLKRRCEHASDVEKLRALSEIHRLERSKRILADRLHRLDPDKNGLWQAVKADVQAVTDDLRGAVEHWFERLDADHPAHGCEPSSHHRVDRP